MIVTGFDGDPVKPGGERRPRPEPPDCKVGLEKNILGQVLHVLPTPQKAADDPEDQPLMQPDQDLEGSLVPVLRLPDEASLLLSCFVPLLPRRLQAFLLIIIIHTYIRSPRTIGYGHTCGETVGSPGPSSPPQGRITRG